MNSTPPSLPGFSSIYWNDFLFKRALHTFGFGLMVAVGIWWVSRPMPNALPPVDSPFDTEMVAKVPPIALGVAVLGLIVAVWRYLRVRKIFGQGTIIRGVVEELKVESWQTSANMDQSHGSRSRTEHSYYITFRYTAQGVERTVRQKLFHSGYTYGLKQGGEVELMVLDSRPDKPLIREVYLKQLGSGKWWKFL